MSMYRLAASEMNCRKPKFKQGDKVRLNKYGLRCIFGSTTGLSALLKVTHVVKRIEYESMTYPEATYIMEVADRELNQFMLNDNHFDLVQS